MKKVLAILLFVLAFCLCLHAKGNSATTLFTVEPPMTCQNCENKIKTNLRFEKGVTDISTNLKTGIVTITYDPAKISVDKLIEAFKKIGYTATVTPKTECGPAATCSGNCRH